MKRLFPAAAIAMIALVGGRAHAQESGSNIPEGYELAYEQDFSEESSLDRFVFTDSDAWRHGGGEGENGGSLELHGQSDYRGPHRSPYNIALIDGKRFGDFILEADLQQTGREYGHRDMCIFFGFQDPAHFYYVHIASVMDDHANQIFIVNDAPRTKISDKTTDGEDWGQEEWHKVRIERRVEDGTIKIYFDDMNEPIMTAEDEHFDWGHIGFGSFDDTGKIDNVRIWAPEVQEGQVEGL